MGHRCINLLSFNVRSLVDTSRQIDLLNTLFHNQIDIAFIQECHLRRTGNARLNGYSFLYDGSPIGVAIAIKKSISYNIIDIGNIGFNGIFIQIVFNINGIRKKYLIGSIYIPCNYASSSLSDGLSKILDMASRFDGFIMGGDLNAKNPVWGDLIENGNGKVLQSWLLDNALDVVRLCDGTPSYPNGSSFLDHFLLSPHLINTSTPNFRTSSLSSFSDHYPIKLELRLVSCELILQIPRCYTSYKNTNWTLFQRAMEDASFSLLPSENRNIQNHEIDRLLNEFNSNLITVHNNHSEKIELKNNKLPLSENIAKFFKVKHRWQKELKKIYHRTGNRLSQEYNILSKQIQLLKTIIKELVSIEQAKNFNSKLEKIKPGPSAFKEVYQVLGKRKSTFCKSICVNNTIISNEAEISEHFRDYYATVYSENIPERSIADIDARISSCVDVIPQHIYSFDGLFNSAENHDVYHFTNVESVKGIISKLNNKKSSGMDEISNFLIKKLPDTAIKLLTIIFNNCINNYYFPAMWKSAKIIPLKKKENSNNIEDFRPISLLSNIGKIFEHVLKDKLEREFIISPISAFQFGFKRFHSTQHALLKFHSDITKNLRDKICTVALSLDIEKAFDSAWHKGILYKLVELGVDPYLVKIFQCYFSDRKFCVEINGSSSSFDCVKSGVPQGSVLAPFLFNLFLYDFPHSTENSKAILYADDCLIYSHNESPIHALTNAAFHLGVVNSFYKSWGISINASKSEAICLRNASGKCARFVVPQSKLLHLSLDGMEIPFKSTIKYLGVNFDKLMKFNNHARMFLTRAKRISGMFSGLMNSKYLQQTTKLLLYKVATIIYAFPIWFSISPTVARELEIFERKILRRCIGRNFRSYTKRFSNTYVYEKSAVVPLCKYALQLQRKFADNLALHENTLMNDIYDYEKDIEWSGCTYLSPIGILSELIDNDDPVQLNLPDFYRETLPGSHRG